LLGVMVIPGTVGIRKKLPDGLIVSRVLSM
jgi:hypothetical protein